MPASFALRLPFRAPVRSGGVRGRLSGLFLVLAALALSACDINAVPRLEEEVNATWGQVLNQYQRRADLVPNLVEAVKGYAAHERETLEAVVEARSRVGQFQLTPELLEDPEAFRRFQESQAALGSALQRLLVVAEQYPQLRASENFLALQAQLEGTENRIAVARRDYIQAVQRYNTELRTFPGRFIADILYPDAEPKPQFTIEDSAMQAPQVRFP